MNEDKISEEFIKVLLSNMKQDPFEMLTVKDVAKDLRMNQNSANQLFKSKDFPSLNFTKPKQICVLSYYLWKLERRD